MKSCSTLFFLVVTLFAAEQVWAEPALPICSYFLPTTDEKLPRQIKDVSSEAQKNMQNYCTTFGAILQSEQRPNQPHFFCQKQAEVLCWFDIDVDTPFFSAAIKGILPTLFYQKFDKDRFAAFLDWHENITLNMQDTTFLLNNRFYVLLSNIDTIAYYHPYNLYFPQTQAGRILHDNALILQFDLAGGDYGVGIAAGNNKYYNFISTIQPFKSVLDTGPEILYQKRFWSAFDHAFQTYKKTKADVDYDIVALEQALLPVKKILSEHFQDDPFLFYPANTDTDPGSPFDIRVFLYFEDTYDQDTLWGRSFIFEFNTADADGKYDLLHANYELQTKHPRSFMVEEQVLPGMDPVGKHDFLRHDAQNCTSCHTGIGKSKIGFATQHPTLGGEFIDDYKNAFYLSSPYAFVHTAKPDELKDFVYQAQRHDFPNILEGVDEQGRKTSLKLYEKGSFGPVLGSPDTPQANQCFDALGPKLSQETNCHRCHNNAANPYNPGIIHADNIKRMMSEFHTRSYDFFHEPRQTDLQKLLLRESFMPYGLYPPLNGNGQSFLSINKDQISTLKECITQAYPNDLLHWKYQLIKKAGQEIQAQNLWGR